MQTTSIPSHRKHVYFYVLLILGAIFIANVKLPRLKSSGAPGQPTRGQEVNKLANSLFQ